MIFSQCNFFSKTLASPVNVNVLIPTKTNLECLSHELNEIYENRRFRTLYLLHGALDDCQGFMRHSIIEEYAEKNNIVIVMPSAQNSFYANQKYGEAFFDYIAQELPQFIEYTFPVSKEGKDRYIAGISMGGYGACKCALTYPERYKAFGSFSGAISPNSLEPLMLNMGFDFFRFDLIFEGTDRVPGTENDLFYLAGKLKEVEDKPFAYIACGEQDVNNYDMNVKFVQSLEKEGIPTYFVNGEGDHDWNYWRKCLKDFFAYIGNL